MNEHTPGPWRCGGFRDIEFQNAYGIWKAGVSIEADITFEEQIDVLVIANIETLEYTSLDRTKLEAEANARLMAASPDLLDALREIYHAFLDADGTHTDRQEAASLKACAAIFKATGGIT